MANIYENQENYIEIVKKMISELQYGTVTLIVQDGKVIQIEENRKLRLKK